jgi:two-component system phosphate regulon sensor histidine kinase PhoR
VNDSTGTLLGIQLPGDVGRSLVNLVRAPQLSDYLAEGDYQIPLRLPPTPEQDRCLQVEVTTFSGGDRLIFFKDVTEQYKLEVMRRDFVGNVSHEMRTPLTVLKGYVQTIQSLDAHIVAPIERPLAQMDMQVVRMEMLLKDLLWLSRIESIENSDKTTPVDMCDLTTELVGDLRAAWPERDILLVHEFNGLVLGDPMELHSAVSNLLVNALKYSDEESEVLVEWTLKEGQPALSVIDKGEGIDPVHIPRLTERFYRVDKSRSQKTGGTGLGLAIVKHVALAHNAELRIQSELGEGSRFSLIFNTNDVA